MDVYRVSQHNQMDYNFDEMESKHGKVQPCHEERFDSGLDSLKEDEYNSIRREIEDLRIVSAEPAPSDHSNEPWKNVVTEDGDTFLHLAVIHEAADYCLQIIKLSHNDPYLNVQNNERQTALHLAVVTDQPELVERLLAAGCDPRLVDRNGNTPLHIACKKGSLHCFSVLTQHSSPAHLNTVLAFNNYSGHTCLHLASLNGFVSLVESLIELGANINAQEYCSGRTALHLAVDLQNPSLVDRLLALGADVNSVTYGGYTPCQLTYGRQNADIHSQLYEKTAQGLRELPDSEDDSEEELSSVEMYDDIKFGEK